MFLLVCGLGCSDKTSKICHYCGGQINYNDSGLFSQTMQWETDDDGNTYHKWCIKIKKLEEENKRLNKILTDSLGVGKSN